MHQDLERDSRSPPRLSQHPRPGGTEPRYQPLMVTEQEAIAIVRRIAPHVIRFAASIVAPLYWVTREPNGAVGTRNGTPFFCELLKLCSAYCGTGLVSSVNDRDISTLLEREYLEAAMGEGVVPPSLMLTIPYRTTAKGSGIRALLPFRDW
jgi:hypothetical protein